MTCTARALSSAVGAEIIGVDLSQEIPAAVMHEIRSVWHAHSLLLFRDQRISPDDQKRFTRFFGELQTPHAGQQKGNEALFIGNVDVNGIAGELPNGEMQFHQDRCYSEFPTLASVLFALEVPASGGNTKWASMYRAYDTLPPELRDRIVAYDVRFNFDYLDYAAPKRDAWEDAPHFVHPLVIAHPETGRPALLCNRLMADSILTLERAAGRALIEDLCARLEQPDNVYEHVWRVGDVLLWDNLATAHARTDFDPSQRRSLRRTAVKGPRPQSYRSSLAAAATANA